MPVLLSFDGIDKQVNSKLSKAFEGFGKTASKSLGDGAKSAAADVDRLASSYAKMKDKAEDSLGKIRVAEAALTKARGSGDTARIVTAEEKLATVRRNSVRDTRAAGDAHTSLLSAQKALGDSSDDLGSRFGNLSAIAGSVGGALGAAGALAGGAALAGIAALGAGTVVAARQLYDLGAQFDDLSDTLTVKTGLSGAALDQLKGSIEKLGTTNVPDTFENIGNVAADVTRNLHLTGQPLEDITSRLANLKRLGVDVNVQALGKAFRGFGVDVRDQVPDLNALYEISTKTGLTIDDITGSLEKAKSALKNAGLSFGESAALASTLDEAGLDVDKTFAGLGKGLASLAKDGKTGKQALIDTVGQIQTLVDAGNDAGALDLSNKLFGAKGGGGFFDAIKNHDIDLQSFNESLSSTGVDINAVSDNTADWSERWQTLKNEASQALEPLAAGVFNNVNAELGNLADLVTTHEPEIIGFFTGIGQAAVTMSEFSIKSFGMLSEGIGELLSPLAGLVSGLLHGAAVFERWGGFNDVADKLDATADSFSGFTQNLVDIGEKAKNVSLSGLYADIGKIGDAAKIATDNANLLKTGITTLPDGKTIVINDTTPENIQRVKDLGYAVTTLPNGQVAIAVQYMYNGQPISLEQLKTPIRVTATPGGTAPTTGGGRALGGLFNGLESIASFAMGKLPTQAMIQDPVGNAGLVQWAEPSTGGEAFIPLSGGDRSKKIWAETGRRLFAFEQGGIRGPVNLDSVKQFASQIAGGAYVRGGPPGPSGTDCSGAQAWMANFITGGTGRFATGNEDAALTARGFTAGDPPAGTAAYWIGWKNGGPGGGHTAGTILDPNGGNVNVEMGGASGGGSYGGQAAGASGFPNRAWIAIGGGEAPDSPNSFSAGQATSSGGGSGGTPGTGPNGEAGTYAAPDAKDVREANEKVADADARSREADLKVKELKADASDSEKASAQNAADKAKREAADARTDLAEVQKGKFTAGTGKSGGKSADSPLKDILGIVGGGLKETLGIGDFLPDLADSPWLKSADAALSAFLPMILGGDSSSAGGAGPQTSSAPFGIPDVAVPPPAGSPASGNGLGPLPGPPVQNITIDQSIKGGQFGWGHDDIEKRRRNDLNRAIPRIPVGS